MPLFETLDDLNNAPTQLRMLFENEWYKDHINGVQECMIGASCSCALPALRHPCPFPALPCSPALLPP